jgi:small subunit ribosomal protein S8
MNDTIADMITQVYNASQVQKESIVLPYSKLKMSILDVLVKAGFIKSAVKKGKKVVKYIEITLAYQTDGSPKVRGVKRISKSSKRIYMKASEIRSVKNGYGIMVVSTPKGVVSDETARKEKVGGEALCTLW